MHVYIHSVQVELIDVWNTYYQTKPTTHLETKEWKNGACSRNGKYVGLDGLILNLCILEHVEKALHGKWSDLKWENENRVHAQFDLIPDFIMFLFLLEYLPRQNQRTDLIGIASSTNILVLVCVHHREGLESLWQIVLDLVVSWFPFVGSSYLAGTQTFNAKECYWFPRNN